MIFPLPLCRPKEERKNEKQDDDDIVTKWEEIDWSSRHSIMIIIMSIIQYHAIDCRKFVNDDKFLALGGITNHHDDNLSWVS